MLVGAAVAVFFGAAVRGQTLGDADLVVAVTHLL
jgi:hypothetical protein